MTIATSFRAALAAHAPLVGYVGTRIAQNAIEAGYALPYIVFSLSNETLDSGLSGDHGVESALIGVQCWSSSAIEADAIAAAVQAAVIAFDAGQTQVSATVLDKSGGYDSEMKLDAVVMTVEWWQQ